MKAITEKVKRAIADLRPAFDKSGLASLWRRRFRTLSRAHASALARSSSLYMHRQVPSMKQTTCTLPGALR
jgi:hypothetical protein